MIHSDLLNREYVSWKVFLHNSESWDINQIQEFQLSEIKRVLKDAVNNTVGYKSLYKDFDIDSIDTIEDFRKLPFTKKDFFRDNLEDYSLQIKDREYITTGGSTGIPCGMYRTPTTFSKELASKAYQYHRVGWKEGDKQVVFRGLPIETENKMQFVEKFNELRCSSYYFGTDWMDRYQEAIVEYNPDWIRCYPSSGYLFAKYLKDSNRTIPKIKGILCSSERLYDFQKNLMNEVFGGKIFSHYGHYEMSVLAGFCEHEDTYHVLPQYGYAELVDNKGNLITQPGQIGEVVATSFIMKATPFIRYKTQDLAVYKGAGCLYCGRPYQVWKNIEGRLQEFLVTRTGRYISTSMLNMHDNSYDHIKQFQFYQKEQGVVELRYIPKDTFDKDEIDKIKNSFSLKLGSDLDLMMYKVDEIPPTHRGKQKLLIQELKLDCHNTELD